MYNYHHVCIMTSKPYQPPFLFDYEREKDARAKAEKGSTVQSSSLPARLVPVSFLLYPSRLPFLDLASTVVVINSIQGEE